MAEPSKAARRRLREILALAHERELAGELQALERELARWRAGEIDAFAAADRVRLSVGAIRTLERDYEPRNPTLALVAAGAVMRGIVTEAEVGPEAMPALDSVLRALRAD